MLPEHIVIQSDPAPLLQKFLKAGNYTRVALLADEHTLRHCYPLIQAVLPPHQLITAPAGEEHKNLDTCTLVWQELTDFAFDRHSLLIVLGGGVLGDLGGFCAATYKRGIDFVLLPTTLLSQVDASIGGKLGIDFQNLKNHIGLFREPTATLIAADFLKTLPLRELRSGFAEIIKHCIISDKAMWEKVSTRALDNQPYAELIQHSAAFKYSVISNDPTEKGLRKILNFGHTIGHAIETVLLASGNRIFHGEAIAIGMIAESWIAKRKGLITDAEVEHITAYLIGMFGKVPVPSIGELMPVMLQDKKNRNENILMALPDGIGKAVWDIAAGEADVKASLEYYNAR